MRVCVLASGSKGNSTYIESGESSVLIDAGISRKAIIKNLSHIGKDVSELSGIFITHEHTDHIRGLEKIDKYHDVPVYMNEQTYNSYNLNLQHIKFISNKPMHLDGLNISTVHLSHDAADPIGYRIQNNGTVIGVITDFGKADNKVKSLINESKCLILETNHDIDMLLNGPYPAYLKQRILSDQGHMSNIDSGILVRDNADENLKTVFLAHLSETNNTQGLASETFSKLTSQNKNLTLKKIITSQYCATELIKV
jgi:phosphoribosyl 1,2-cyclic phosphodiesterase